MNAKRFALIGLITGLLGLSLSASAYDIDIYSGLNASTTVPNIVVILDDSANSDASVSSCSYWDGTLPGGSKASDDEKCALANLIHSMSTNSGTALLALGIASASGMNFPLTPVDDNTYTGLTPVTVGGGSSLAIPAGTSNRNAIILAIKSSTTVSGSANQGPEFQETWAYYTGGNGSTYNSINTAKGLLSGRIYPATGFPATSASSTCQKNYILFLSSVNASSSHANTLKGTLPEVNVLDAVARNALALGNFGSDTSLSNPTYLKLDPLATGYNGTILAYESPYGVEWARLLYNTDTNSGSIGTQNIITYSIAVGNTSPAGTPIPSMTNSMEQYIAQTALYGGGKYFAAGTDPSALQNDILKIFNEVQAVNSVFSSSSLPVSVNAQGTFLNQIFMGMFRPDAGGNPRWLGNLKQYQFIFGANGLQLGDSVGQPAISSSGTGFISANAISFWTCTNLGGIAGSQLDPYVLTTAQLTTLKSNHQDCPDTASNANLLTNGFWAVDPASPTAAGLGFDLPDGEIVERGGAAEQIRQAHYLDNYTTAPGSSTNSRRLYTFCPAGAPCDPNLTGTANIFDTSNANVTDALLGTGQRTITSITSAATANPNSPLAGWTAPWGSGVTNPTVSILSLSSVKVGSTVTVTATVSSADWLSLVWWGYNQIKIATGNTTYDCNPCIITGYPTSTTFTYTSSKSTAVATITNATAPLSTTCPTLTSPTGCAVLYTNFIEIYNPNINGTTITAPTPGQLITVSNCVTYPGMNGVVGAVSASWIGPNWFVLGVSTPFVWAGFDTTCKYTPNTATVVAPAHGLPPGDVVTIAGASPAGYNGSWPITVIDANTFTYQYTVAAPLATWNGAGAAATGTTVTRDILTKWMRGDDIMGDENSVCPQGKTAGTAPCPNPAVMVRPSVHGDVLHARPTVLNYGYHSITITGTSDSGTTRTATASATDVATITLSGASPIVTFANGDACVVTITSGTTFTYQNTLCGVAGGPQTAAVGSKVVVFYGDNGGVFHAVNGNLAEFFGAAGPGDELWGFIPKEHLGKLVRLASNSPMVKMPSTPSTITPTPQPKDYFVDGEPGILQYIDGNGNTVKAVVYMAFRRGGNFIYALDVTTPTAPVVLWKIDNTGYTSANGTFTAQINYSEMGQTWSQPKVTKVAGYCNNAALATPLPCSSTNLPSPVLIFGAGYDTNEDNEPLTAMDSVGRGIFVVDALTGARVWAARHSSTGTTTYSGTTTKALALVAGMDYAIPSAVTLIDRDGDGVVDRLYVGDLGGNIWRVDLEPAGGNTPDQWRVYQVAALGGSSGACGSTPCSPTQRKFFYPPEMIAATTAYNFDAIIAGSGDREHPLFTSETTQAVTSSDYNHIFLIKDPATGNDASSATTYPVTVTGTHALDDCTGGTCSLPGGTATGLSWCKLSTLNQNSGYFINLSIGEKVVNAPLVAAGFAYMSTNQPSAPSAKSCNVNLGTAFGYQISPFCGTVAKVPFSGGGLPPSPVAGVVDIAIGGVVQHMPFLIGAANPTCTGSAADCNSALGGQKPPINVATTRQRTYWYIQGK